jgi:phosphoribosyl 1,2-cyclic phosphodiesterase
VRVTILGSGSKGNATLVEAGGTAVLVDAGLGPRVLVARVDAALGRVPEAIHGVVLTHAHRDHAHHAPAYARRFGCPVYLTEATQRGVRWEEPPSTRVVGKDAPFRVGELEVRPFPIPHDAPQVALTFEHAGERMGLVTDLGHVPPGLAEHLGGCATLLLESNHDVALLREGPYPEALKRRVGGSHGHLSNDQAAALLERLAPGLDQVVLMHLSEANNRPELAFEAAKRALRRGDASLSVAHQERPITLTVRARQLAFGI